MAGVIVVLLGVLFVVAGMTKLSSPEPFRAALRKLLGPPLAGFATRAIPVTELVVGSLLLPGIYPRPMTAISVVMLLVFSAALLRMWRKGVSGCGCVGEASESAPSGLARNAILIALALVFVVLPQREPGVWAHDWRTVAAQLTVVVGSISAWPLAVALVKRRDMVLSNGGLARQR
jgi:uncharacterized membrane protein YphA (DoxX/SURF4 family)